MRRWVLRLGLLATLLAAGLMAARRPSTPAFRLPAGWPQPVYDGRQNPVTRAGFELGRALFYDTRLSRDGQIACASCHQPFAAFAHFDHRVSHGVDGRNGTRNAPALFNLAWSPEFMWDGAVHHLEVQPLAPLTNPLEMDASIDTVVEQLRADPRYIARFAEAFGTGSIDSQHLLWALTQFMITLISSRSSYDVAMAGGRPLDPMEARGLKVFRQHCNACHTEPLFTDHRFRSNGLDAVPIDPGRSAISGREEDRGLFRVPSLRNVALTPPYMHDGRFDTLDEVLDHYEHGIQASPTLDPLLRNGIRFAPGEREALRAFLNSLSDDAFTHDTRFVEPESR
jgi:cytochrome c peroxidase